MSNDKAEKALTYVGFGMVLALFFVYSIADNSNATLFYWYFITQNVKEYEFLKTSSLKRQEIVGMSLFGMP